MAVEGYESRGMKKRDNGLDITAVDSESNDKVLLRVISCPESRSGFVGTETVERMVATIENEDYDKGILISERFTQAAVKRLKEEGIQRLSENMIVNFGPERLYLTARAFVDDLCKAKCGRIPQKESDCKGHLDGRYSCEVRLVSDNASFHFGRGWTSVLQEDVLRLLSMNHSANDQRRAFFA